MGGGRRCDNVRYYTWMGVGLAMSIGDWDDVYDWNARTAGAGWRTCLSLKGTRVRLHPVEGYAWFSSRQL